jgi:hypothetical protein
LSIFLKGYLLIPFLFARTAKWVFCPKSTAIIFDKNHSMLLRSISVFLLLTCSFLFAGCPLNSTYPLLPKEEALSYDKTLTGTWSNDKKEDAADARIVRIEKGNESNTYTIKVLETGELYSTETKEFKAWLGMLNNSKFLVLEETGDKASTKSPYLVYAIKTDGNKLITNDIALKVKGTDAITSVKAYQEEVVASMKYSDFLAEETAWKKQ